MPGAVQDAVKDVVLGHEYLSVYLSSPPANVENLTPSPDVVMQTRTQPLPSRVLDFEMKGNPPRNNQCKFSIVSIKLHN